MTDHDKKDEIKVRVAAPAAPAFSIGGLVVLISLVLLVKGISGM